MSWAVMLSAIFSLTSASSAQAGVIRFIGEEQACAAPANSPSDDAKPTFEQAPRGREVGVVPVSVLSGPDLVAASNLMAELDSNSPSETFFAVLFLHFPDPPVSKLLRPS